MEIPTEDLYPIQAAMEQWTDGRLIEAVDLENLLLFLLCVPKALSQSGYQFQGFVSRHKNDQELMTIKVRHKDTPLIVFVSGANTIHCMTRFLNLWEDDRIAWRKDRYPWI